MVGEIQPEIMITEVYKLGNTFYFSFEPALMQFLQNAIGETGAQISSAASALGEEFALILILGFLYWCYDKQFGVYVGTNAIIAIVLNPMIKNIFFRRRPYMVHPEIKCIRPIEPDADIYDATIQGYSFPSGHAMNSAVVYGSVARYAKKKILTILAFILPLLVGLSRVLVGVHYPTDVLGGWLVGLAVIFIFPAIYDRFGEEKRWLINLIVFLVTCVGIFYCRSEDYFTGLGIMAGFFLGLEFEKRFVNFEVTKSPLRYVMRIVVGGFIYIALNVVLKMPFSSEFLASGTLLAYMVRAFRYCIILFVEMGVYPIAFGKIGFLKEPAK